MGLLLSLRVVEAICSSERIKHYLISLSPASTMTAHIYYYLAPMMSKNALYNLISDQLNPKTFSCEGVNGLFTRTHSSGSPYFLFELPADKSFTIDAFTLESHHVSVYEQASSKLELKSQYHYTAYFKDDVGDTFRLHVFYDGKDNLVAPPLFSKLTPDNTYESLDADEYSEAFAMLASLSCKKLTTHLRATQAKLLQSINDKIQTLDAQASELSKNPAKNKATYQAVTLELINHLENAQQFSNDPQSHAAKKVLLSNIRNALAQSESKPVKIKNPPRMVVEQSSSSSSTSSKKPVAAKIKTVKNKDKVPPQIKTEEPIDLGLSHLSQRFEQWKTNPLDSVISELHAELVSRELGLQYKSNAISIEDVLELHRLRESVEHYGRNCLLRYLMNNEFSNAERLSSFKKLLAPSIVYFALVNDNIKLLTHLYPQGLQAINFREFTFQEKQYASLIDFCFRNSTVQSPKLNCLIAYLAQGGSLLAINEQTGLPFAATLLMQPSHPLASVLSSTAQDTIGNPMFFKKLNNILQLILKKGDLTPEMQAEVSHLIETNKRKIADLDLAMKAGGKNSAQRNAMLEVRKMECLGQDLMKQIEEDDELQAVLRFVVKQVDELVACLPPRERASVRAQLPVTYGNLASNLEQIKKFDCIPSFEVIKDECLKQQQLILDIVSLKHQELAIRSEMPHQNTLYTSGQVRKYNKARNELIKLRQKSDPLIKELEKTYKPLNLQFDLFQDFTPDMRHMIEDIFRRIQGNSVVAVSTDDNNDDDGIPDLSGVDFLEISDGSATSQHRFFSVAGARNADSATAEQSHEFNGM